MDRNEFSVLIVDDEPEARSLLKSLLSEIKNVRVIGEADTAEKALYYLVEHYPQLVFLDLSMPGKSGIEFIQLLQNRNVDVSIVIVSAYKKYAVEALRNGVYDFILKPVDPNDLRRVTEKHQRLDKKSMPAKLMEVLNSIKEESKIRISSKHSYILLNPDEIVYCESNEGYTNIYLTNGKTEVSNTSLSQIENKIKNYDFFRLGRSILINKNHVRAINKTTNKCILRINETNYEINTSRKSINELLMNNYNYA